MENKYICLNNHPNAVGGPFTRYDPSCPKNMEKMSCLDLVLISQNLLPYFQSILIDSAMKFSPSRPTSMKTAKYPDHFPVIVSFSNLPKKKPINPNKNVHTMWNTNKEGGWEVFKSLTDDVNVRQS